MKEYVIIILTGIGTFLTALFGEWSYMLQLLLFAIIIDLISGLIVAGVFQSSKKTTSGGLSSNVMGKGICKKSMILAIVALAHMIDRVLGTNVIQQGVIIAYIMNEILSLLENATLIGLPIPEILTKALDLLEKKGE